MCVLERIRVNLRAMSDDGDENASRHVFTFSMLVSRASQFEWDNAYPYGYAVSISPLARLFCSVLFLNSDRSRHPPHPCFKVLRFGLSPRRACLPSTSGMEANCSPRAATARALAVIGMYGGVAVT